MAKSKNLMIEIFGEPDCDRSDVLQHPDAPKVREALDRGDEVTARKIHDSICAELANEESQGSTVHEVKLKVKKSRTRRGAKPSRLI